jgi:hypothetical protein
VMWFFLPAHSFESANLVHISLISLAGLPLGERTYSCQRQSPLGRAGPWQLLTAWTPTADAALPSVPVSDSKAWPASVSRSSLLIAVNQKCWACQLKYSRKGQSKRGKSCHLPRSPISCWVGGFLYASRHYVINGLVFPCKHQEHSDKF